jgi:hypothetical protein
MLNILTTAGTALGPVGVVLMTVIPLLVGIAAGLTHREDVRCQLDADLGHGTAMGMSRIWGGKHQGDDEPRMKTCPTCKGAGEVTVTCAYPPGHKRYFDDYQETCPTCNGSREVPE